MTAYIYTDASYFPKQGMGSFAFWIDYGGEIIKMSGVLDSSENSLEAETMCICNALYVFLENNFKNVDRIIIHTDSLQSITKIRSRAKGNTPYKIAWNFLKEIRIKYGKRHPIHKFKHIKAHSGLNTVDKRINSWCDREARKIGRKYINKLNR